MALHSAAQVATMDAPVRKRERRKEARPSEIIDAALDVFGNKGFAAARLDDIASHAGISKGTLYLYFTSKEELLKAAVRERVVSMLEQGRETVANFEGTTADLLKEFLQTWWELEGETNVSAIPKIITSEARNFPDLASFYVQEVIEPAHIILRTLLKRGVDSGEFAPIKDYDDAIHAVISGVIFLFNWKHSVGMCMQTHQIAPQQFIANFADMLINGLAVRGASAKAIKAEKPAKPAKKAALPSKKKKTS